MADLAISARQAAAALAAFANAWREAVPDEPPPPPPPPPRLIDGTLAGRELTGDDLQAMFEREFEVKEGEETVVKGYRIDPVWGRVNGRCIFAESHGWGENRRVTALALKHLIEFDEKLFLEVADCDGRTTRCQKRDP